MPLCICPNCQARYNIPAEKLGPSGRTLRCAKCGQQFFASAGGTPQQAPTPQPQAEIAPEAPRETFSSVYGKEDNRPHIEDVKLGEETAPLAPPVDETLTSLATLHSKPVWVRRASSSATLWVVISLLLFVGLVGLSIWNLVKPDASAAQDVTPPPISAALPEDALTPPNLVLSSLTRTLTQKGQTWVLTISGTVTNTGKKRQIVPEIRVQLLDADNVPLDFWPAEVASRTLDAKESTAWQARFLNPDLGRISTYRAFFRDPTGLLTPKPTAKKGAEGEATAKPAAALDDTPTE